jgi:hypothetical protein
MNVIFDNFNGFFTGLSNVTDQLLQNKSSYMIAMKETEQLL